MRQPPIRFREIWLVGAACLLAVSAAGSGAQPGPSYRVETRSDRVPLRESYTATQVALLEKLNRADLEHLERLPLLVVPDSWSEDERAYSPLPAQYPSNGRWPKLVVVHLPGQVFGAYEFGVLVRWGPISSGGRTSPAQAGTHTLNWRSIGRASTVDPDWFMRWYFNFGNREGLAFHAYSLPGYPASHGCIRLLTRDAQWLFDWGESWTLDATQTRVLRPGTPVLIVGAYDFAADPPWRSEAWLSQGIELPERAFTFTATLPAAPRGDP